MMMRPFYRSRLFWLGVPGLVFLLWVWWDSGRYDSFVRWERTESMDTVMVGGGRVEWEHTEGLNVWILAGWDPWMWGRSSRPEGGRSKVMSMGPGRSRQFDFCAPYERKNSPIAPVSSDLEDVVTRRVALWVIVAGYVMAWLGAVWWWQRRKRKRVMRETEVAT